MKNKKPKKSKNKNKQTKKGFKGCKMMYSNVDSIKNKKEEIFVRIEKERPNIIAFTKTYPKGEEIKTKPFDIPNYEKFCNEKPQRGVVLYIENSFHAKSVDILNSHEFEESTWCSFESNDKEKILIGCIYKSPSSSYDNYILLKDLLNSQEISKYDKMCIMGDFNFPKLS